MNNSKLAAKNSAISLCSQIVAIIFQFTTRSILVHKLGVELLGVSSVFTSVLRTLCLAELGFEAAIVYSLYRPLHEKDQIRISRIVNVLRVVYRAIGLFVLGAGVLCMPFLRFILKNVTVTPKIYLIFLLQLAGTAGTYLLAYRRALLYADKREFMTKLIDTSMNVIFSLLKIFTILKTGSYVLYVMLTTMQTVSSNIIVHVLTLRIYPYLKKESFDREIFDQLVSKVKNVFIGKIAGYIYNATDSLVVSVMVNATAVGFMVNYTTVTTSIRTLSNSLLRPIAPIIGSMVNSDDDRKHHEQIFRTYTCLRYLYACFLLVPMTVLLQSFVCMWVGEDYLLSFAIVVLLCTDLYIHLVHSALCDFINGKGLFRQDKNTEIAGACSNLVTSIILAKYLGIAGVLIGTVVSQMLFWICRSIVVFGNCFDSENGLRSYWIDMLGYGVIFALLIVLNKWVYSYIALQNPLIRFLIGGVVCELVNGIVLLLCFGRSDAFADILRIVGKLKKGG